MKIIWVQKKIWVPKKVDPEEKTTVDESKIQNEDTFEPRKEKGKDKKEEVCEANEDLKSSSINRFKILDSIREVDEEAQGNETIQPLTSPDNSLDNYDTTLK